MHSFLVQSRCFKFVSIFRPKIMAIMTCVSYSLYVALTQLLSSTPLSFSHCWHSNSQKYFLIADTGPVPTPSLILAYFSHVSDKIICSNERVGDWSLTYEMYSTLSFDLCRSNKYFVVWRANLSIYKHFYAKSQINNFNRLCHYLFKPFNYHRSLSFLF